MPDKIGLDYLNRGISFNLDYQEYDYYIEYTFSEDEDREEILSDIRSYVYDNNKLVFDPIEEDREQSTIYALLDQYGSITTCQGTNPYVSIKMFTEGYGYIPVKSGFGYVYRDNPNDWFRARFDNLGITDNNGNPNFKFIDGEVVKLTDDEKAKYLEINSIDAQIQRVRLQKYVEDNNRAMQLAYLTSAQAAKVPLLHDRWDSYIGRELKKDTEWGPKRVYYNDKLWEVRQDIPVVLENQPPGISTAALYKVVDVEHAGTFDDPIPYDQTMDVVKDKYYIEDGIIYKCTRSSTPLYASCASLVRIYFEVASN